MKPSGILSILFIFISLTFSSLSFSQIPAGGTDFIKECIVYSSGNGKGTFTKPVAVTGQPFTSAIRYATLATAVNSWDAQIVFQPNAGIATNDVILVAFYARTISSIQETGLAALTVCIEHKTTYAKAIYQNVSIATEWKQYFIPFKSNATLLTTEMNCAFHTGFASQTIEVADVHFINYANTKTIAELPETVITYVGQEPDAGWRAEADARINLIRKGNVQIKVVDSTGTPVQNAEVKISMKRHDFAFGSAVVAADYLTNPTYKAKILELFNEVVFENDLKWSSYYYKTAAQKNDLIKVLDDLKSNNITMRGHNVLWPSYKYNPTYLAAYKANSLLLRLEIDKRIDDVCTFTKGRVVDWDVINEPYTEREFMDLLGKESMADWLKRVRNNDPYVKMYINDFAILSGNGTNVPKQNAYMQTVSYIDSLGGGVQGIGFQGHFGSDLTPITRLKSILDKFSVLNKDFKVTEFDIDITQTAVQADYTRDFYTMLFSHPSVKGILMWGFWESRHWKPNSAMYNADWSIRPNGVVYSDLVLNKWWTKDTILISNDTGYVSYNGFLGTYSYSIKTDTITSTGTFDVSKPVVDGVVNEFIVSTHPKVPAEIKIAVTGGSVFCEGKSSTLSLSLPSDFTIKWFKDGLELPETTASITVADSGIYSAEASGKGVVLLTEPVKIKVNSIPAATIDSSGSLTFCPGANVTLSANLSTPFTYKWFKNGVFFSGSTPDIIVSESGRYKVEVNSLGCKTFSPELTVKKLNALDAICITGIANPEKQLSVSPNPFTESIFIDASGFDTFPVNIELIDVNGKVAYKSSISGPIKTEISPDVCNGFYLLKMQADNRVQWHKVVRQF